jgi:hypothetical protein
MPSTADWPREVGDHRVTADWECATCGGSFDCLSQFRSTDCEGGD